MLGLVKRYTNWLHTKWPAGTIERMPIAGPDGETNLPGIRIIGDLSGIPLLKFSSETAARAVRGILAEPKFRRGAHDFDLVIVGGGVAGISAAIDAKKAGLKFVVIEATQVFFTVVNFPKAKPIFAYPTDMVPSGGLQFRAQVKEALVEEIEQQRKQAGINVDFGQVERLEQKSDHVLVRCREGPPIQASRVIVAIGRSGSFRKLGVAGEDLDKVYNRLHDPKDFSGKQAVVVGGGDAALETAIALVACGAHVTLSYRKKEFSRPKPENLDMLNLLINNPGAEVHVDRPASERVTTAVSSSWRGDLPAGSLRLALGTMVNRIDPQTVILADEADREETLPNDVVFSMIGRAAPLEFLRRSGIRINGEWTLASYVSCGSFFLFCCFLYLWKGGSDLKQFFEQNKWFPFNIPDLFHSLPGSIAQLASTPGNLLETLRISMTDPGFYYSAAYACLVIVFGFRRMQKRRTPYIRLQTFTLMAIQLIPLFLLPFIILPWMGHNGMFDHGFGKIVGDQLFPVASYGQGREYWRAFGLILAWPLFIWNLFTDQPMWWWLIIGLVQTFVIIPLMVRRWGKGAYCGWICSCGALAETLGDGHRQKMPHGPIWNRVNMVGQVILGIAFILLLLRVIGWLVPGLGLQGIYYGLLSGWKLFGIQLNYYQVVDTFLAGTVGVGVYFWFSGRVWCRFACPLAALMHIYARFSKFRIFAEKKKCISCNVCTSVCHQGIDIMNFANKGMPMEDPECVRCSACVQMCPTGVLSFGRLSANGKVVLDQLAASPVQMRERK